jgi:hypothetical protein
VVQFHSLACAWIAASARYALLHGEGAEPAYLHSVTAGKRFTDLSENRRDDVVDVMASKVRIGCRQISDEFRFGHSVIRFGRKTH